MCQSKQVPSEAGIKRVSVCMASYNGGLYIKEQVTSILAQLGENDELVVTDDCSSDDTVDVVESFCDPRIRVYINEVRLGYVQNFARAITLSRGEYIALSDQDDIWPSGRLKKLLLHAEKGEELLVIGDFLEVGNSLERIDSRNNKNKVFVHNCRLRIFVAIMLGRSKYFGCCFLLRRNLLQKFLPIPRTVESHDMWIALMSVIYGTVLIVPETVLLRRIHGSNVTSHKRRAWPIIIETRVLLLLSIFGRVWAKLNDKVA